MENEKKKSPTYQKPVTTKLNEIKNILATSNFNLIS
jgi:hypothetical protein